MSDGGSEEANATLKGNGMSGTVIFINGDDPGHPAVARIYRNTNFSRGLHAPAKRMNCSHHVLSTISPFNKPVLTIAPGDTVHTTTVDAGGTDEKG